MSQPPWPLFSPSEIESLASPPARGRQRRTTRSAPAEPPSAAIPIIALCHLSWSWVWQRPQQFLSRFARTHPVLFVETYCSDVPTTRVDLQPADGHPNVTILQMHLPAARWSDADYIDAERRRTLRTTLARDLRGRFDRSLLWFNDPMAVVAFAGHLGERAIVYDCMDELSQFKGAPPILVERERELLRRADVIFCGGQRMRQKRLPLNPNCHFFGTGVDIAHFGRARTDELAVAPEIAAFGPGPVLGYFGVIDERIDYDLLAHIADARPGWHIAMVGPTAKVDPATFPQRPNLHWLGGQPYARLPEFAKGFSVAVMPFALNAATEFINPTKALEYMAAGRPVVSTALAEVRLNFGRIARIADSADEFIEHCDREISRPSWLRISRGLELAAANTWEAIVARMETHIARVLAPAAAAPRAATRTVPATGLSKLAYV
jgi:glycosyltransferase involved in cell wall biosynthesis